MLEVQYPTSMAKVGLHLDPSRASELCFRSNSHPVASCLTPPIEVGGVSPHCSRALFASQFGGFVTRLSEIGVPSFLLFL